MRARPMRLVSYNILDGGAERCDALLGVIERARPDVVALIEADDSSVVALLAGRLRMDSIQAAGASHEVALLSRWPIVQTVNHGLLRSHAVPCFLEATIMTPGGEELPIGILHLRPYA